MKHWIMLGSIVLLAGCVTTAPQLGTNTLNAKENLNTCINGAFSEAVLAADANAAQDPRKDIAIAAVRACDERFATLERSLVVDGESPESAIRITDESKVKFYQHLIRIMNTDWKTAFKPTS